MDEDDVQSQGVRQTFLEQQEDEDVDTKSTYGNNEDDSSLDFWESEMIA